MTASSSSPAAPGNSSSGVIATARPSTPAEIDTSCSAPLVLLFVSAALWLTAGTLLCLIASIKLHSPGFLANVSWLTFGRIRPAGMNALLYGFASQAAIGIMLWLTCRLGAVTLCCRTPVIVATAFWNFGVTLGILGVLAGASTGFAWLEMPGASVAIMFGAYAVIGVCVLVIFFNRVQRTLYVSQWYLLAALFWFPWILSAAGLLLLHWPVRGVLQAFVNTWYTNNLLYLWLAPVALAALFYFIPKLINRPLYSSYVAALGFWTHILFAGWTGSIQLIGGPLPAWMIALGTSAALLMIIPTIAVAYNWYMTIAGIKFDRTDGGNVVLRCILFGALSFFVISVGCILLGRYRVSSITQFSFVPLAFVYFFIFGFFGITAFGTVYYVVPRATATAWPSEKLIRWHYFCSVAGVGIVFLALLIGGLIQGYRLNQTVVDFADISRGTIPFVGFATLGFLLLLAGQIAFLKNLFTLLHRKAAPVRSAAVELFVPETARAGGRS